MRIIKLLTLTFTLVVLQSISGANPKVNEFQVTGYVNASWIKPQTDLEFIQYVDRIFYFGMSPDSEGRFVVTDNYIENYKIVRSKMNNNQKILLVVGGGAKVANMHVMGNDSEKREAYVKELVAFAKKHKFDGIDMDWETDWKAQPKMEVPVDNLIALLTSIKKQMPKNSMLTAALGGSSVEHAVAIEPLVDDLSLMLYSSLTKDGLHAPLSYVKDRVKGFDRAGYPKSKLLVGVPFYARGPEKKTILYRDIADNLTPGDTITEMYKGCSFNSIKIMRDKVKFMKEAGYKGIMIWELTQDAPYAHPMSLLRAIYNEAKKE
ncbi:MAG: glycoside hydrolase family 18 protein [Paludibacter sp.]|nr:glycoside hydrolase family 18 protein [Paludibacter sp.]